MDCEPCSGKGTLEHILSCWTSSWTKPGTTTRFWNASQKPSAAVRLRVNKIKKTKNEELVINSIEQGWKARCTPIEFGCRGFTGSSLYKVLSALGITWMERWRTIAEAAEEKMRWFWIRREKPGGGANATRTEVKVWSTSAGSPGLGLPFKEMNTKNCFNNQRV